MEFLRTTVFVNDSTCFNTLQCTIPSPATLHPRIDVTSLFLSFIGITTTAICVRR
jgi:hypothetical protein